jgi:phosphoribosylformimino-5-aminoimidazole carboxamide ribotide isomerase
MEVIPVLDLLRGVAVHARQGAREHYRPVQSTLLRGRTGDPLALARAYRRVLGAGRCYVADLDAIQGWTPQRRLLQTLADGRRGFGPGLLVDAGINSPREATLLLAAGMQTLVVGLETLRGFAALKAIVKLAGGERVIFSLDLLDGKPMLRGARRIATQETVVVELAARAVEAGCETVLVLDLSAVGSEAGPRNLDLLNALKRMLGIRIYAGGGVRSAEDLRRLAETGCDGALVGTAIHNGAITRWGD